MWTIDLTRELKADCDMFDDNEDLVMKAEKLDGMNLSVAVFLFNKAVRGVLASYQPPAEGAVPKTEFFKTLDPDLAVGDFAIVPTQTRHGMTVVRIEEVDVDPPYDADEHADWIIDRVDRGDYEITLAQESKAIKQIKTGAVERRREQLAQDMLAGVKDKVGTLPIFDREDDPAAP